MAVSTPGGGANGDCGHIDTTQDVKCGIKEGKVDGLKREGGEY